MVAELSESAQAICAANFNWRTSSSCKRCPLHSECKKPSADASELSLGEWRDRVNQLAEQVQATSNPR